MYKKRSPVDAREFLKKVGEVDLGVFQVENLHLSIREDTAPNSYYTCLASAAFS
jgi:hypothetical protein